MIDEKEFGRLADKLQFYYDLPGLAVSVGRVGGAAESGSAAAERGPQNPEAAPFVLRRFCGMERPGKALAAESRFHMASVSKLFTAAAVIKLRDAGKLNLSAPLVQYLPEVKTADPRFSQATVLDLLTHTSGLPDVQDYHWDKPETDEGALLRYALSDEVQNAHLLWAPAGLQFAAPISAAANSTASASGTSAPLSATGAAPRFAYSNIAYELLGLLVARLSGLTYEDAIRQYFFAPLGMDTATMFTPEQDADHLCAPFTKDENNHFTVIPHFPYTRCHAPSSTLTGTVMDAEKWAAAHLTAQVFPQKTIDELWTPHAKVPGTSEKICLGWFRRRTAGVGLVGYEGGDDGFRSSFWLVPEKGLWIILLCNLSGAPLKGLSNEILRWVLPQL
ncbi:MAG: beta-lactamase family protein [Clostridiales bacterium]|nr:beta-lactamase family protein [Clostridiales bacterium]